MMAAARGRRPARRQRPTVKSASQRTASARGLRVLILSTEWNLLVVDGLVAGAQEALLAMGALPGRVEVVRVPGALELPLAADAAARSGRFDAIVALGAVIRGETDHYDHVAREVSTGLAVVARESGVPVGFGVLTVRKQAHALARSARNSDNKGAEAAHAAVAMVEVLRRLGPKAHATGRAGARTRTHGP
jgi:6,7-dimethyl-8-ribityllumazine synthase